MEPLIVINGDRSEALEEPRVLAGFNGAVDRDQRRHSAPSSANRRTRMLQWSR